MSRGKEDQGIVTQQTRQESRALADLNVRIAALEKASIEENKRIRDILARFAALEKTQIESDAPSEDRP